MTRHLLDIIPDGGKHAMDLAALGGVVVTVAGWLPPLASLLTVLWFLVRFYDRIKYGPHAKSAD